MLEAELAETLVRKVLPSYEIKEKLGEGSFGAVFRIKDELKERAAKIILLSATASIEKGQVATADKKIERDFRHIVDSYEQIACDEIVTVYDFYKVTIDANAKKETAYAIVVMEMYPSNLLDYLVDYFHKNRRPLDIETGRAIMERLAMLLGNLYTKRGFLFEDLKPENLLIKGQGDELKIVVGDIGGLKSIGSISSTGSQVTLSYCASEVLRKGQKPDLRSIMYSYGLISYFALEGHLPYESSSVSDRIDLIKQRGLIFERTDIPDNLRKVIERCLAFEPTDRYGDFNEIVDAIRGSAAPQQDNFGDKTVDLSNFRFGDKTIDLSSFGNAAPSGPAAAPGRDDLLYRPVAPEEASMAMTSALSQRMVTEKRRMETVRISDEKEAISRVEKEIRDLVIKSGDLYKLQNESYKVYNDIKVEKGALLVIENVNLYFDEDAGIVSLGTLRAKNSVFSAIDFSKRWKNIVLIPTDTRISMLKDCKFRFGKGRNGRAIETIARSNKYALNGNYSYGGALFIAEIKEKMISMGDCEFYNCTSQEGGALYCAKSDPAIENCVFDNCFAGYSGGAMKFVDSKPVVNKCRLNNCSTNREGGGIYCVSSNPAIADCSFDNCSTKYFYGGGIFFAASNPMVRNCKFVRCSSTRDGGGIYCDNKSRPKIVYPSFMNCKPNNSNCV